MILLDPAADAPIDLPPQLLIRAPRALIDGTIRPASVTVRDGRIDMVLSLDAPVRADQCVELSSDDVLLPGLVDTHVHINEPGRTEWEGFSTASRSAAAAGVTTLIDMPLNSIPVTTTLEALATKRGVADGQLAVDTGFWGGAVPENLGSLAPLHDAGVFGFKCFLTPSGIDEFGHLDSAQLHQAMVEVAGLDALLLVHAEDPSQLGGSGPLGQAYGRFLASRPPEAERMAIARVLEVAASTGCRVHILHLSDAGSLPMIAGAKRSGVRVTVETCPHYLTLDADHIPDSGTEFKCCPPIRDQANQDLLWAGIVAGEIDLIVSDHSPSTVELKRDFDGDFGLSWGGIAGLQLGLVALWKEATLRGITLDSLVPLLSRGPADLVGLSDRGRISPGAVADFVVFSPDVERVVDAYALQHKNPISAYHGRIVRGAVRQTWQAGHLIAQDGIVQHTRRGQLLTRPGSTPTRGFVSQSMGGTGAR